MEIKDLMMKINLKEVKLLCDKSYILEIEASVLFVNNKYKKKK